MSRADILVKKYGKSYIHMLSNMRLRKDLILVFRENGSKRIIETTNSALLSVSEIFRKVFLYVPIGGIFEVKEPDLDYQTFQDLLNYIMDENFEVELEKVPKLISVFRKYKICDGEEVLIEILREKLPESEVQELMDKALPAKHFQAFHDDLYTYFERYFKFMGKRGDVMP